MTISRETSVAGSCDKPHPLKSRRNTSWSFPAHFDTDCRARSTVYKMYCWEAFEDVPQSRAGLRGQKKQQERERKTPGRKRLREKETKTQKEGKENARRRRHELTIDSLLLLLPFFFSVQNCLMLRILTSTGSLLSLSLDDGQVDGRVKRIFAVRLPSRQGGRGRRREYGKIVTTRGKRERRRGAGDIRIHPQPTTVSTKSCYTDM